MAKKTSAKKPTKTPVDPFLRQASDATRLRYGPELDALQLLKTNARSQYISGRVQANRAAELIANYAQQAQGGLADTLARIGGYQKATQSQVPSPGNEGAIVAQNMGLTGEAALGMLAKSGVRAQEGAEYQKQRLRDDYMGQKAQIDSRLSSLLQDAGVFTADTYNKLLQAQADRDWEREKLDTQTQTQLATSGLKVDKNGNIVVDPDGKLAYTEKNKQKNKSPWDKTTTRNFRNTLTGIQSQVGTIAGRVKSGKVSFDTALNVLVDGLPEKTVDVVVKGPDGKPVTDSRGTPKMRQEKKPGMKGVGKDRAVVAKAALEVALYGGITSETAKELHASGVSAKSLGLKTTVTPRRKKSVDVGTQTSSAVNHVVSQILGGLGG